MSRIGLTRCVPAIVMVAFFSVTGCSSVEFLSDDNRTIVAQFDSGAGLYVGNEVAVLGMKVGRVTAIDPRGTAVDVTMKVDSGLRLPIDVQAVTVSTSILTDRQVELTPVYRTGPTLPDNGFIPLDRTRTPIEFDRLLKMTDTLAQELGRDQGSGGPVAELLSVSAESVEGNGPAIRGALDQLSKALKTGADPSETRNAIVTLVDNLDVLSQAAARNDQVIRDFGSSLRRLSDLIADQDLGQGVTGAQLNDVLTQATDLLADSREDIQGTATSATIVTSALADYRRELSEFVNLAPLLMNNAYRAVDFENQQVRVHTFADRILFDQQMLKEVCNLLGAKQLGCATGRPQDFGPDFGVTAMLAGMAGVGLQ